MIFNNYTYFLTIVKCKNISKAANELFISQPALSGYIKRLEIKLGVKLFEHSSNHLKLTYTGERYLYYVNKYILLNKEIQNEFSDVKSNERGKVMIGISPWRSSYMLPIILPHFKQKHPHIEIKAIETVDNELCVLVDHNEVDFSIKCFSSSSSQFHQEIIMNERILLAINNIYLFT